MFLFMFHGAEPEMRVSLMLLLLITGFSPCGVAQLSFSDSSRMKDPLFVREHIREISETDLWASLDLDRPDLKTVRSLVQKQQFDDAATAWGTYWTGKKQPSYVTRTEHLLLDTDLLMSPAAFRSNVERSTDERDTILARAAMILKNTIRVWGDSVIRFGDRVDFNREMGQSGKYGFHYWWWSRPLIMAAVLHGDQTYTAKFDQLFNSWYEQRNSISRGFPELDVVYYELGLGTRNRLFIENYLLPYRQRTGVTHGRMLKTVLAAGRWLHELERWEGYRPGNWQIHGSSMLVQLALVFPEFRESAEWLRVGLQRLSEHLERDFYPDGGHSERCPRNYTLATYLNYRNIAYLLTAYEVRRDVRERIHSSMGRTIDWWIAMLAPTGEIPAINDSHRGLFPAAILRDGATLFGKPEAFAILRNLFGENTGRKASLPEFTSRHMPASGFSVMRTDWSPDASYLTVNYGPSAGFHSHYDLLDFELYAYGKPMAVDAGIGLTYDDPLYHTWYRSSRAHNMVTVNDSNIAREGLRGENIRWGSTPSLDFFAGEQRGYQRFGVHQRRQIAFVKPFYWFILDDLSCARSGDTLSWYFHSPGKLLPSGAGFVSASLPGLCILPAGRRPSSRSGMGWAASSSNRTPGKTEEIPWIRFDQTGSRDSLRQFAILLAPIHEQGEMRSAEKISERHYVVSSSGFSDHLYFTNGSYADGVLQTDGAFVLMRLRQEGAHGYVIVDGKYLSYGGKTIWRSDKPESAEGNFTP
jgi:hypothetical protein